MNSEKKCKLLTKENLDFLVQGSTHKKCFFEDYFLERGVGDIPNLYVKFWWPLFLTMDFTFLFLNLAKIHIFVPKSASGGVGGPPV